MEIPATRRTDPRTSLDAERSHTRSGKRDSNIGILVAWVRTHPGYIATEIAEATGIDRHETSRRLADARALDVLENGAPRAAHSGARKQITWYPVDGYLYRMPPPCVAG